MARRPIPGSAETAAAAAPSRERSAPDEQSAAPSHPVRRRRAETSSRANAGWGAVETLSANDGYITPIKIGEDPILMKFLEDRPFDVLRQHWFEAAKGQKGWRCLNEDGNSPCPLCDQLGDDPQAANSFFNVLAFLEAEPTHQVLRAPKGLTADIKKLHEDGRFKGLTDPRLYVAINKKKEGEKRISYPIEIVRARDLEEEWDVKEPTPAFVLHLKEGCHTEPISGMRDADAYQELIDELLKQS